MSQLATFRRPACLRCASTSYRCCGDCLRLSLDRLGYVCVFSGSVSCSLPADIPVCRQSDSHRDSFSMEPHPPRWIRDRHLVAIPGLQDSGPKEKSSNHDPNMRTRSQLVSPTPVQPPLHVSQASLPIPMLSRRSPPDRKPSGSDGEREGDGEHVSNRQSACKGDRCKDGPITQPPNAPSPKHRPGFTLTDSYGVQCSHVDAIEIMVWLPRPSTVCEVSRRPGDQRCQAQGSTIFRYEKPPDYLLSSQPYSLDSILSFGY